MQKIRSFLALTVVMMLIITACLGTRAMAETADAPQSYTAGTYTATVPGRNGDITVEVTFDADRIASVNVVAHNETAGISDGAINGIPASILDDQTLAVDVVSKRHDHL